MNAENRRNPPLVRRINGNHSLTDRGNAVHKIVGVRKLLRNDADPNVEFKMSEEQRIQLTAREESLRNELGLSSDEKAREETIQEWDRRLTEAGFPHYKMNHKKM